MKRLTPRAEATVSILGISLLAPVLIDGRLRGYWRLTGTGRRRDLAIRYVKGARRPTKSALAEPISALKMALDSTIGAVDIGRD